MCEEEEEDYDDLLIKKISKIDGRIWAKEKAKENLPNQSDEYKIYPVVEYLIDAFKNKIEELERKIDDLERKVE